MGNTTSFTGRNFWRTRASVFYACEIAVACMVALVVASACSPQVRQTPDDKLVMLVEQVMKTSDPRYVSNAYDSKLGKLVTRGLTSLDADTMKPQLDLAASIELSSPTDGLVTL